MHDGSVQSLPEVIVLYDRGRSPKPWLSGEIRPLALQPEEQADLVAFLQALTGRWQPKFRAHHGSRSDAGRPVTMRP